MTASQQADNINSPEKVALPLVIETAMSFQAALLRVLLLCVLGCFAVVFPISMIGDGSFRWFVEEVQKDPVLWMMPAFQSVLLICFLIASISMFYNRQKIRITTNEVRFYERKFPFPAKQWTEPIGRYAGLSATVRHSRKKHDHTIWYGVYLVHHHKIKNIKAAEFFAEAQQQSFIRQLALALNQPIVRREKGEYVTEREPEKVNETLHEREGVAAGPRPFVMPPAREPYTGLSIKISETSSELTAVFEPKGGQLIGGLMIAAGIIMLAAKYFFRQKIQDGMAICFIIMGFLFSRRTVETLIINASGAHYTLKSLFVSHSLTIPLHEIEEVKVTHDPSKGTTKRLTRTVQLSSAKTRISFGYWSKEADRQWLAERVKACILILG